MRKLAEKIVDALEYEGYLVQPKKDQHIDDFFNELEELIKTVLEENE